jgi:hypothetical protein
VAFLQTKSLPLHCLGQVQLTVLHDEDIISEIKMQMIEKSKNGYVKAEDLVNLVASPKKGKKFLRERSLQGINFKEDRNLLV